MSSKGYNLAASFLFAIRGVFFALGHERNLRIHFAAAALAFWCARYFGLTRAEWTVLIATVGLVIVCELVNTAIETAVDLFSPTYSRLAKAAKDVAAGAVLVSAGTSVAIGWLLLGKADGWLRILAVLRKWPVVFVALAAVIAFWIILPGNRRPSQRNNPTRRKDT